MPPNHAQPPVLHSVRNLMPPLSIIRYHCFPSSLLHLHPFSWHLLSYTLTISLSNSPKNCQKSSKNDRCKRQWRSPLLRNRCQRCNRIRYERIFCLTASEDSTYTTSLPPSKHLYHALTAPLLCLSLCLYLYNYSAPTVDVHGLEN